MCSSDLHERLAAQLAVLQQLQTEGKALGEALRVFVHLPTVPTKLPAVPLLESFRDALRPPTPTERIGGTLDKLDAAIRLCGGIRQAGERNRSHARLAEVRVGMVAEQTGVFRVIHPFTSSDGLLFGVGALVDRSLLGDGTLHRLLTSRYLRPVDTSNVAAA